MVGFFFLMKDGWFFVSTVAFCTPWWLINLGKEHCISEQVLHVLIKWGVGWPLVCGKYTGNARVAWSGINCPLSSGGILEQRNNWTSLMQRFPRSGFMSLFFKSLYEWMLPLGAPYFFLLECLEFLILY